MNRLFLLMLVAILVRVASLLTLLGYDMYQVIDGWDSAFSTIKS